MPVRKIPLSHRSHITGRQPLAPGMRSIAHESSLERDFVTLMRFDPNVVGVEEQPVAITWRDDDGRMHRYTPDYRVVRRDGAEIVEVKYRADLKAKWPTYRRAFAAARQWAGGEGMKFRLATERGIRGPLLDNAKRLLPRAHDPIDGVIEGRLLRHLVQNGPTPFSVLSEAVIGPGIAAAEVLAAMWALIARRHILTALDRVITGASMLSLPGGGA